MSRLFAPKAKPEAAPVAVTPPPAAGLTKDEIKELVTGAVSGVAGQLNETVNRLGQKVEELAGRQPQVVVQSAAPAAQPHNDEISDQDIDTAVLSGQGAAQRIRAMVDRAVNKATARIINEHVKPLQDYGVNTLGELSRRVTTTGMKHYDRYKKEIDERLNTLTPDVRANPVVIETIYNAVVGMHSDELSREAAEAAVRQAQDSANATGQDALVQRPQGGRSGSASPGTGAGRDQTRDTNDQLPDINSYLGSGTEAGMEALQHKGSGGQDQDAFARGLGYKDWASYMKQYQELLASETAGNA